MQPLVGKENIGHRTDTRTVAKQITSFFNNIFVTEQTFTKIHMHVFPFLDAYTHSTHCILFRGHIFHLYFNRRSVAENSISNWTFLNALKKLKTL